jgi:ABC-type nitrate/sulfonate/bicarbonate transport system substrate-binding protein
MLRSQPLRATLAGLAAAVFATTAAGCASTDAARGEPGSVNMLLAFPKSILWTPLMVAEGENYFNSEDVNVSFEETEGSSFVTQQVISGNAEFGYAVAPAIVIAATKDPSLRVVSCIHQNNLFDLAVLEDSPIQSIEDLAGKKIGYTVAGGGDEPLVNALLNDYGLRDSTELLPIGGVGPQWVKAVTDHRVDAFTVAFGDIADIASAGIEYRVITPEGYDGQPGGCLFAKEQTLVDKHDELVAFLAGALEGAAFAQENPEDALATMCDVVGQEQCGDMERARNFMQNVLDLMQPEGFAEPVLSVSPDGFETTAKILQSAGVIEELPDIDALADSEEAASIYEDADKAAEAGARS